MSVFQYALGAVLPMVLEILLGYWLHRAKVLPASFFSDGKKLAYKLLIPAAIFQNIYAVKDLSEFVPSFGFFIFIAIFLLFFLSLATAFAFFSDPKKRGVVGQVGFRSNFSIIAMPLAQALGGAGGAAVTGIVSIIVIPEVNILSTVALTLFQKEHGKRPSVKKILWDIIKNPMVVASILASVCLLLRTAIPLRPNGTSVFSLSGTFPSVYSVIAAMAKISGPFSLLMLGGSLKVHDFSANKKELSLCVFLRLVLAPLIVILGAVLLEKVGILRFGAAEYTCIVGVFASPLAVAAGVMSAQMGGDGDFADQVIVLTTVFSAFTVFGFAYALRFFSLI